MCHCIMPQSMLSALVGRAQREGTPPTTGELESVLTLGCTRDEVEMRFSEVDGDTHRMVVAMLDRIA